jgi:hypothetical protein
MRQHLAGSESGLPQLVPVAAGVAPGTRSGLWHRENGTWEAKKVITIPAEPADVSELPPALQPFGAVPPLVSDIDLSVDDRWLYVSVSTSAHVRGMHIVHQCTCRCANTLDEAPAAPDRGHRVLSRYGLR